MARVVQRPKLTLAEKTFLPGILKGLFITFRHAIRMLFGKTKVTMQYPEKKWDKNLPSYYRGVPALVKDELGNERCVSCQLCEFICPPRAIEIIPGVRPTEGEKAKWAHIEKAPKEFDIDMTRCIYCGLCEEVCPEQAIFLTKKYAVVGSKREELLFNKQKLYEIGGVRKGLINKWNGAK